jgi:hypothetical protein
MKSIRKGIVLQEKEERTAEMAQAVRGPELKFQCCQKKEKGTAGNCVHRGSAKGGHGGKAVICMSTGEVIGDTNPAYTVWDF